MEFEDRAKAISVRFVLLLHTLPDNSPRPTHWDLMIEAGDSLLTFSLQSLPPNMSNNAPVAWSVTRLPDHRHHYLKHEGAIATATQVGAATLDRGSVHRLAAGNAVCIVDNRSGQVHCQLRSPELSADFCYAPGPVGEATQLHIKSWHWA